MKVPNFIRSRFVTPSPSGSDSSLWSSVGGKILKRDSGFTQKIVSWLKSFRLFIKLQQHLQNLLISIISVGPVPQHVSFIMDGNRRFAKRLKIPVKRGHEAGGLTLLSTCYALKRMGVRCVSAYAFSIENFNRPPEEVSTLTEMFAVKLDEFARRANDYRDPLYQSKLRIIGDHSLISEEMREKIKRVEEVTSDGDSEFTLFICFPYTSRNDICHATQEHVEQCLQQNSDPNSLTVNDYSEKMYLENFSDKCDLLIRTSGHLRLSDYMLWQVHQNSNIKFSSSLWPDFNFFELYLMILNWSFFTTIQRFIFFGARKDNPKAKSEYSQNLLEKLPPPPKAVSITGECEAS